MIESDRDPLNPLRNPKDMFEADFRNSIMLRLDPKSGQQVPHTLDMHHSDLEKIQLNHSVPIDAVDKFDLAKNLCLYAWYQYTFGMPAYLYSFIALEVALREKYLLETQKKPQAISLYKLANWAVDNGFIKDGGFSHLFIKDPETEEIIRPARDPGLTPDGTKYPKNAFTNTGLRNSLAHGERFLIPPYQVVGHLRINADAINQLFPLPTP